MRRQPEPKRPADVPYRKEGVPMKVRGLDRVIVLVRDLDAAMEVFSTKLGVEFVELEGAEADGQRACLSLDHQMELVSPIIPLPAGAPGEMRRWVELLREREAILLAIAFRVDDVEAAVSDTQAPRVVGRLELPELPPLPIHHLKERVLSEEDTLGIPVVLVEYQRR
jgi:catechol 2,3-dioxygenase-like lactoylglutathione lyase family enzyme